MFQIVEIAPRYCPVTDGIVGQREVRRSHGYMVEALAHRLAELQAAADYEAYGDNSFMVVRYGESAFTQALLSPKMKAYYARFEEDNLNDCPF